MGNLVRKWILSSAVSVVSLSAFATVADYGGLSACGGIEKFWDVDNKGQVRMRPAVEGEGENERHYELLTDEVLENGIDWSKATQVSEGMWVIYYKVEPSICIPTSFSNAKQKFHLAKIDLTTPGLRMTGPGRCNRWGEIMTDTTTTGRPCGTLREKTTDFMMRCRGDRVDGGRNKDVRLAFNACAWGPWSDNKDQTSAYADANWPLIFDGVRVDCKVRDEWGKKWGAGEHGDSGTIYNNFVMYRNGTAGFLRKVQEADLPNIWVSLPYFGSVLVNAGTVVGPSGQTPAQRTNIGLSQDGRYLFVLVADGRDGSWGAGPTYEQCGYVQKAMGAYGAFAVDGGGSSTLATWDTEKEELVMHNYQSGMRRNGSNCGIYFYSILKQDDTDYRDADDYVGYGLAAGDVATIVRDTSFTKTNGFPRSCTVLGARPGVTLGWGAKVSPTVHAATRVLFTNITFAAGSRTLTVRQGGTAAIASDVLDKVVTADAAGFELAGALTADLAVACAGADSDGEAFGFTSVASPDEATLRHLRHPADAGLYAKAVNGQLIWKRLISYSSVTVTPGYDFTNAVVTATVSELADFIDSTYSLRLTVSDRYNHTAAVFTKPVAGPGVYVFDTADAESQQYFTGYGFDYVLELLDPDGDVAADEVSVNGALNFANKTSWFSASVVAGPAGGAWAAEEPPVESGTWTIAKNIGATFEAFAARGGDVIIGTAVTFSGAFARTELDGRLADYVAQSPLGALTICEDAATGANVWCGIVKGASGEPEWKYLYGRAATPTVAYRIAEEIDFSQGKPYVSYLVAAPSDPEPVRLKDADGTTWFDGIGIQTEAAGKLVYDGEIRVADLDGDHLDKSVAEAGGEKFATFGEAAAAGGTITLLTNVSWTPDREGDWTVAGAFDLRLNPSAFNVEYRDGRLVVTGDVPVPSRFPVDGSATVTAIVSDEFIQTYFPGKDISKQADFDAVAAGLNAPRTEGNRLTLLQSYILGLDPDDATAVPQATIAANPNGNGFVIALGDQVEVNEAADVDVKYALRSADDVSFKDADETEPGTGRTFVFEPQGETKKFFRISISFTNSGK